PHQRIDAKLVGIVVTNSSILQDDVDAGSSSPLMLFTPALTQPLLGCCVNYTVTGVRVDRPANVAAVQHEIAAVSPAGLPTPTANTETPAKVERAIRPDAIALAVFGAIAALAALVIGAQVAGRQLRLADTDRAVLRG